MGSFDHVIDSAYAPFADTVELRMPPGGNTFRADKRPQSGIRLLERGDVSGESARKTLVNVVELTMGSVLETYIDDHQRGRREALQRATDIYKPHADHLMRALDGSDVSCDNPRATIKALKLTTADQYLGIAPKDNWFREYTDHVAQFYMDAARHHLEN